MRHSFPHLSSLLLLTVLATVLSACQQTEENTNRNLSLESLERFRQSEYALSSARIREHIGALRKTDTDLLPADQRTRKLYAHPQHFFWIDRLGVSSQADTLLSFLEGVEQEGINLRIFRTEQIAKDLERARTLQFDKGNSINDVYARLEYNLTRAYLRYAVGQNFGFVDPAKALNRFELVGEDTVKVKSRLYDIPLLHADDAYVAAALERVAADSVGPFLRSIQPHSPLYTQLLGELQRAPSGGYRKKVLVNMERARWRMKDPVEDNEKYVMVNVASQQLYAVSPDSTMTMRVACGATRTKTPLLASRIKRMEVNPVWRMPFSIIKGIAGRAGSSSYFASRRYSIFDGAGRKVDPSRVTRDQLLSGRYSVVQKGGKGNSLGRIVFRFDNTFSVYLHDTSSPWVFQSANRLVSHGCVRVQRPYDLALFLLSDKNRSEAERIKYSMKYGGETRDTTQTIDSTMIIKQLSVDPQVPVCLNYFTIYPDLAGRLHEYPDVYGYDKIIANLLTAMMK